MTSLGGTKTVVVIETVPELTVPDPRLIEPLLKKIVPVAPLGTFAVMVTGLPYVLGPEVVTVTVGVIWFTTWTTTLETFELYCEVILCDPTDRLDVVRVAVVPVIPTLPMLFVPSKKLIVPVLPGGTVVVNVTDWR
jgi:hypothetical protein